MKKKQISACILSAALVFNALPISVYGEPVSEISKSNQSMSLDATIEMAIANSMTLRQLNIAKEKAMDGYSKAENGGSQARAMLDMYNSYQKLYSNGAKDELSKAALSQYQAIFGNEPSLNFEQMYDQFVVPSEITPYQVYIQFQSLKIEEPVAKSIVAYQTKQLYYGILSYQHSIKLMSDSLKISKDKLVEMELKYNIGQVAKVTLEIEKINYEKTQRTYEQQKKELKILESQFNLLIGQRFGTEVKLQDPGLLKAPKVYEYHSLVSDALLNRSDLKKHQLQIDGLNHEIKLMSKYLRDEKLDRRVDAEQRLLTKKLEQQTLEINVKLDVLNVYNNYRLAEEQIRVSSKKVAESEKQLTKIKQLLKAGYVKKLDVYAVELQLQNSKLSYESAVYEYNKTLDALTRITVHSVN